jgi:hypothetical protein
LLNPIEFENLIQSFYLLFSNYENKYSWEVLMKISIGYYINITQNVDLNKYTNTRDKYNITDLLNIPQFDIGNLDIQTTLFIDYFENCQWDDLLLQYKDFIEFQLVEDHGFLKKKVYDLQNFYMNIIEPPGFFTNVLQKWTNIRGPLPGYEMMFELLFNLSPWFLVDLLNNGVAPMLDKDFVLYLCQKLVNLITIKLLHPTPTEFNIDNIPNLITDKRTKTFENSPLDQVMRVLQPWMDEKRKNGSKLHLTYFSCFNIPTRETLTRKNQQEMGKRNFYIQKNSGFTVETKKLLRNAIFKWFKMFYKNTDPKAIKRYETSFDCSDLLTERFFTLLRSSSSSSPLFSLKEYEKYDETSGIIMDTRLQYNPRNYPRIEFLELMADPGGVEKSKEIEDTGEEELEIILEDDRDYEEEGERIQTDQEFNEIFGEEEQGEGLEAEEDWNRIFEVLFLD